MTRGADVALRERWCGGGPVATLGRDQYDSGWRPLPRPSSRVWDSRMVSRRSSSRSRFIVSPMPLRVSTGRDPVDQRQAEQQDDGGEDPHPDSQESAVGVRLEGRLHKRPGHRHRGSPEAGIDGLDHEGRQARADVNAERQECHQGDAESTPQVLQEEMFSIGGWEFVVARPALPPDVEGRGARRWSPRRRRG